jgi:hypothetical protein
MSTRLRKRGGLIAGAVIALGLAGCGATSAASSAPATTTTAAPATSSAVVSAAAADTSSPDGLTPPGKQLGLGQAATVGWVPLDQDSGTGAKTGLKLQISVESIVKGNIADFKNIDLKPDERKSTPYYVTVRMKALGATAPTGTDDPDIVFQAIDDRGQEQPGITFLGSFDRCDDKAAPKPFANGKSYESCLAYLMPGGGSIRSVQWNSGPAKANDVTPYFENPVVWQG